MEAVGVDQGDGQGQGREQQHGRDGHAGPGPAPLAGRQQLQNEAGPVAGAEDGGRQRRVDGPGEPGVGLVREHLQGDADDQEPAAELFVYRGTEHYFAEHDEQAAALLTQRVLAFLG